LSLWQAIEPVQLAFELGDPGLTPWEKLNQYLANDHCVINLGERASAKKEAEEGGDTLRGDTAKHCETPSLH